MAYEISWVKENRIVRVVMRGNTDVAEARRLNDELISILDANQPPTHFITNVTEMGKFPTNAFEIKNSLKYLGHANAGWFLIVGGNVLVNTLATVLTQILKKPYRMFKTEEAALAFLAQQEQEQSSGSS